MFPTVFALSSFLWYAEGSPHFYPTFLLMLFLLMLLMHHSTLLFIGTKNRKINFLHCLLFIQAFCMVYYFLASLQVVFLSFPLAASC